MESYNNLFDSVCSLSNLSIAWRKAKEGKTLHTNIIEFEKDLEKNLINLYIELKKRTYKPRPLNNFILRDPKTRKISKSDFRDRVVHHALINVTGNIFEKSYIYDSCANQIGKGTLFALKRFSYFAGKVTKNGKVGAFCLKADIKHYFQEVDHEILMSLIKKKIRDENVIWLIQQILNNTTKHSGGGRTT